MTDANSIISGNPRARVLVLTSTFPRRTGDSTPPFVLDLCRQLAQEFEVHVLAPHAPGARLEETMDGVHVHRFRYLPAEWQRLAYDGGITERIRRNPLLLFQVPCLLVAQLVAALRLERALRPALIHAHWLLPQGLVAVLASRLCRTRPPVLCTLHGTDMHGWNFPPLPSLKRWLLRAVTRVTAVSASLRDAALAAGAAPDRVMVLPMGVDVDGVFHFAPGAGRSPGTVVFVGRLVTGKGVDVLLRAWARVPASAGARSLVIVGDGPLRPALEAQAAALGIRGRVQFRGALPPPAVAGHLRSASAAAFPFTAQEGLGLAAVEAQACGCPVVVSDIAAMTDLVQPGVSGLTVPVGDVDALAGALSSLLADGAMAGRLAVAARGVAESTFGWESVGARYRDFVRNNLPLPL